MQTVIRISYGTAIVLGLIHARQDVAPTTAYLLYDSGCIGSCSFCCRANGNMHSANLSRIIWPEFEFDEILSKLTAQPQPFKRICLQTGYNPETTFELKKLAELLIKTGIPTSITLTPSQADIALELLENGLDHVGIGLDAATKSSYTLHKKRDWDKDWPCLLDLMKKAGEKIEVHLIFGLDDSEQDFMERIQAIVDAGGKISLFAFTPVNGGKPPSLNAYRRVQAFRYLCEQKKLRFENCRFKAGVLCSLGMTQSELEEALNHGEAFRTSGCGDCNRPYYNEKPGQPFFNFPRPLFNPEFEQAIRQLQLYL